MKEYVSLLQDILDNGKLHHNRTGVDTLRIFGRQCRFDLSKGFPLVTTKKMWMRGIIGELIWYLRGDCNLKFLHDNNIHIWDGWQKDGHVWNCYGKQWRHFGSAGPCSRSLFFNYSRPVKEWEEYLQNYWKTDDTGIDQVARLIDRIKTDPDSRRLIINAWNPADEDEAALPWCQSFVQFDVEEGKKLNCQFYMRSSDAFLGLPWNIAFYALFTHMVAQVCDKEPGNLIVSFGNLHLYENHSEQVKEQLCREPYPLPTLALNPEIKDIDDFKFEDIKIVGYRSHAAIKGEVSV